jgi:hypothetical protein
MIRMCQKYYVEYLMPGIFMPESSMENIQESDMRSLEYIKGRAPEGAFAFIFKVRTEIVKDKEILVGRWKELRGRFYIGGTIYTLQQMKRIHSELTILISNMECNGWKKVIQCSTGNWQPFMKEDKRV